MAIASRHQSAPALRWPREAVAAPREVAPARIAGFPVADAARMDVSFFIFCIYTFILIARPQDYLPALATLRPALVLTALSIVVTIFLRPPHTVSPFGLRETKLYLFLFAVMVAGIPFSLYPTGSFEFVLYRILPNVIFFLLFVLQVTSAARLRRIALVFVLSIVVFSVMGLYYGSFGGGRYSTGSTMFDANDVAFVQVSLIAFTVYVLVGSFGAAAKLLAFAGIVSGVLLALYTGSRGGLVGLGSFFLLFMCIRVAGVTKARKMVLALVLSVTAVVQADKINVERYLTIFDLTGDYNTTSEQGRAVVWRRGLEIFSEHPLTGVGVSRFLEAIGTMRSAENVQSRWQAAHNAYIQILVDTGIFGAATFLLLIVGALKTFWGLGRGPTVTNPGLSPPGDLHVLGPLLFAGFLAHLVTAAFLSQGYSIFFSLWFAVAASVAHITVANSARQAA